jgi:hypothetical protein
MELEVTTLSKICPSFRKTNITYFLSYAESRPLKTDPNVKVEGLDRQPVKRKAKREGAGE